MSVQSGTHPVFVTHLRDSYHISKFGSCNFLDVVEMRPFYYWGQPRTTKDYFNIDFMSLELTWTPSQSDLQYLYDTQLKITAGDLLGLNGDWIIRTGTKGTHSYNHGFDMVIGSSGRPNYVDSGEERDSCRAKIKGNYIVTMDGWRQWPEFSYYDLHMMLRATLHEIFHTYSALDLSSYWYIMSETVRGGDWVLHSDTNYDVSNFIGHYDGPP